MSNVEQAHARVISHLIKQPCRVFVAGGIDSGKTTFAMRLARAAVDAGMPAAVIDSDLAHSTIGPPATIGLKIFRNQDDFSPESRQRPDSLAFVGSVSPRGKLLPVVAGTAKLVFRAIELGAKTTIVDTSALIAGVAGQYLQIHSAELCRPHFVVSLARGGEMEPINSDLRRLLSADVVELEVHPDISIRSVDERIRYQERSLAASFGESLQKWRVKPTVFMPSLPPDFDLSQLDSLLVGIDDGHGNCLGLGLLEYREETLRLLTSVADGIKALRLGSIRATTAGRITGRVDLPLMLGTD